MKEDLFYYAFNIALWLNRLSWNKTGSEYRILINPGSASWSNGNAVLDPDVRLSVLTHEFTHGILNTDAPGLEGGIAEGLCDTYGIIIGGETDHMNGYSPGLVPIRR